MSESYLKETGKRSDIKCVLIHYFFPGTNMEADIPWQCNALLEATSIRNILPTVDTTWHLNNYICFLMGRHTNSLLKDQKIVIPLRIHAQHETTDSAFYEELLLPHYQLCLWVKSLANLKARILNLQDKISFLRSVILRLPCAVKVPISPV